MIKVGYIRQSEHGPPIDEQRQAIVKEGVPQCLLWEDAKRQRRTKRNVDNVDDLRRDMIDHLRDGDMLCVYGLDRLAASSTKEMMRIVAEVMDKGVSIKDLKTGWLFSPESRDAVGAIRSAIVQLGNEKIAGVNKRRRNGEIVGSTGAGRALLTEKDIPRIAKIYHDLALYPTKPLQAKAAGVSEATYYRFIKKHAIDIESSKIEKRSGDGT
jgi:DNA invertase Pin-like site-specific DNA recombinase